MKYISTFELFEGYNKPRAGGKKRWSVKYKRKIDCNNPKGFSQKQYCKRKKGGGSYKNESMDYGEIKNVLEDIFLEVTDRQHEKWMVSVDAFDTHTNSVLSPSYKVYITFGNDLSWQNDEHDGDDDPNWRGENQIPFELIESIKRSINFMTDEGFQYKLSFVTMYSEDPSEDVVENIELEDLGTEQWLRENEEVHLYFFKR
jgi:hypothetical protein